MLLSNNIKSVLFNTIFFRENKCIVCDKPLCGEMYLCTWCSKKIKHYDDKIYISHDMNKQYGIQCYICEIYSKEIAFLISKLKYKGEFIIAEYFSKLIYKKVETEKFDIDLITFVPSTKKHRKKRGYNQSEVLSKFTATFLAKKELPLLKKVLQTKDQIGLDTNERRLNVKDAFEIAINKKEIKDKRILIIDDVVTTGATIYNCGKVLLEAGAREVIAIAVARAC